MSSTILQPGEIETPASKIPFLRLPERKSIFRQRARRLRGLAANHTMADFLSFMAHLADAQQAALDTFPEIPLPDAEKLGLYREHGMPPLAAMGWQRDPAWRAILQGMMFCLAPHATPTVGKAILKLQEMPDAGVEAIAGSILRADCNDMDLALAPLVASALQVYWTHMATTLGESAFARGGIANLCPVCASAPVASTVRTGGAEHGLRYLQCSLCSAEWHMVRVKCSNCEATSGISYYGIEGSQAPVKAEACEECGSYLKILYMEKDPHVEPVADDLATLTLDVMMNENGLPRSGPNLLLVSACDVMDHGAMSRRYSA